MIKQSICNKKLVISCYNYHLSIGIIFRLLLKANCCFKYLIINSIELHREHETYYESINQIDGVACCNIYVCVRQLQCLDWMITAKASKHNIAWSSSKSKNTDQNLEGLNDCSNDVQRSWAFFFCQKTCDEKLFVLDEFIKS